MKSWSRYCCFLRRQSTAACASAKMIYGRLNGKYNIFWRSRELLSRPDFNKLLIIDGYCHLYMVIHRHPPLIVRVFTWECRQNQAGYSYYYIFLHAALRGCIFCSLHSNVADSPASLPAFINGTLINEVFADEMLRVKNCIPAISMGGFEDDTDFRRGGGAFKKVEKAISVLKAKRLPFGASCCLYFQKNVDMIGLEAYFDRMICWSAKFCWFYEPPFNLQRRYVIVYFFGRLKRFFYPFFSIKNCPVTFLCHSQFIQSFVHFVLF